MKTPPESSREEKQHPASSHQHRIIEVSAALIFHDGKLLITQRHAKAHLGGLWEFPGGKREPGESFEECLVREIREELGVEISVCDLFEEISHDYPEKSVRLKFFVCQLLRGEVQALDCQDFAWVNRSQLADYNFPEADEQLLKKLRSQKIISNGTTFC